ncbi:MAG: TIGR01777 family oxidoreductase [Actinomycetota bacterium]
MTQRTIAITGASGLIGTALSAHLRSQGHRVVGFSRRPDGSPDSIAWEPASGRIDSSKLSGIDAVVHLAGAGIGDKRWSDAYKREILESRTKGTKLLASALADAANGPRVLLSGSAIGYYGESITEEFTESSRAGRGFLADVCVQWEDATEAASKAGIRVAHLRTGIVLSPRGGALKKLLPLFKLGAGGRMGSGKQWQSWISIDDEVGAIDHLLTSSLSGAVNLTAPKPVTQAEFTAILARVLKRPALLPVPSFGPKLLLGDELATALLFTGQKVLPKALTADGYTFQHPDLESALRSLLNRPA